MFVVLAIMVGTAFQALGAPPAGSSVGLISKVILDVSKSSPEKDWTKAQRGETVASGDRVRTGDKSVAVVKFKDNSLVRVRERSELTITGEVRDGAFSKSVNVEKGVVGFNIRTQQPDEEFRFTSPTSVASIRGTGGQFASRATSDTLTVIEGVVDLLNKISSRSVSVAAGFTGISQPDGSITARPSTAEERQSAMEAARVGEQDNRLEFELRDQQGNRKNLRIEYK